MPWRHRKNQEQQRERAELQVQVQSSDKHQGLNSSTGSASSCWMTLEKSPHLSVLCRGLLQAPFPALLPPPLHGGF